MIRYQKYSDEASLVNRLGWRMDSCGDATIVYGPGGSQLGLLDFKASDMVTVCDRCWRASCWHGVEFCDHADIAGTVDLPRRVLIKIGVEHEDYFSDEELIRHTGQVAGGDVED